MARPAAATIDAAALRHNLAHLRAQAPGSRVLAVVKADGYGHGLERVARALIDADGFGVACLEDAERLRAAGLKHRIVLLSGFVEASEIAHLYALGVDTVVHDDSQLRMLAESAVPGGCRPLRVWLKLDSGMHRLGFPLQRAREVHAALAALPGVDPEITLMSHFSSSDEFDSDRTPGQIQAFAAATADLPGPRSLSNSAAVLGWPQAHGDWIRPGGALYGVSVVADQPGDRFGLRPAMTLSSRLIAVRELAAGEPVGYGAAWRAPEPMRVGVVALGYGDGYPRAAPAGTPIRVAGVETTVVGRVSMDLMTVDLRGVPEAVVGSTVVAWGDGLPVERVAQAAGTIGYELVCSVTRRVGFVDR